MSLCKRPTPVVAPPTVLLNLVLILPGAIAAFSCPTVQVFEGRRLVFDTTHDHANQVGVAGVAPAHSCVCRRARPLTGGDAVCHDWQESWDGTGWLHLRVNVCVCGDVQVRVLSKVSDVSRSTNRGSAASGELHRLVAR